ncbi:MAG: T9SS type A sorting domain-containing protein [Bacteroidota bacterium]
MKKILTLIVIALISSQLKAQFTSNWENRYQFTTTSNYSNEARKVATDASGNIFELADVTADRDSAGNQVGGTHFYVIVNKFNSGGVRQASRVINVGNMALSGHDYFGSFGLEVDQSTGYVYVGYSKYNASANYDVNIAKFSNSLNNNYWTSVYATGANDFGVSMKLRGTSPIVLVKSVSGANTTYSIVKMDGAAPNATALYSFVANTDVLNALTAGATGNLFVTGYSMVSGSKVAMTASVNMTGGLKWQQTFNHNSTSGDDYGSEIMIGADGDIYVSGTTYTDGTSGSDVLVIHYGVGNGNLKGRLYIHQGFNDRGGKLADGPAGFVYVTNVLSTRIYVYKVSMAIPTAVAASCFYAPAPQSAFTSITGITLSDIKTAASNNIYLCGSVTASSTSGNFNASYLCKIGPSGANLAVLNSTAVVGGFTDNYAGVGVALDAVNNRVLSLRSYWSNYTSHATEKVFLTSLSGGALRSATASDNLIGGAPEVSFFPNPASGTVNIRTDASVTSVEVYDLIGKVTANLKPVENSLDISMLRPGLYLAKVITTSGVTVKRITVE